jgi:hypothetical protein
MRMTALAASGLVLVTAMAHAQGQAQGPREVDAAALFEQATQAGRVGEARRTRPVDARPAQAGEVVVTVIQGDGVETRSRPAAAGDWVARNRCPATGNEQYLIAGARFPERYGPQRGEPDAQGWREFHPTGVAMQFFTLTPAEGEITFMAPWGERMVGRPGDVLVRDPGNLRDLYRIYSVSFGCTYEITRPPQR